MKPTPPSASNSVRIRVPCLAKASVIKLTCSVTLGANVPFRPSCSATLPPNAFLSLTDRVGQDAHDPATSTERSPVCLIRNDRLNHQLLSAGVNPSSQWPPAPDRVLK